MNSFLGGFIHYLKIISSGHLAQILWLIFLVIAHVLLLSLARVLGSRQAALRRRERWRRRSRAWSERKSIDEMELLTFNGFHFFNGI